MTDWTDDSAVGVAEFESSLTDQSEVRKVVEAYESDLHLLDGEIAERERVLATKRVERRSLAQAVEELRGWLRYSE
ncbi:hypothetical protein JCM19037_1605 [Geomicrobium sp. JCM 19037]|uniref:hypothetical protein n=1 Tax=Geomicrobium sp. JCM 19037 TaxID=1460634 RepID=UPI00045F4CB2|nr:hypothetical protein [Geomicrobium sp. JCM 19037]GAK03292.1 hypothetical protein JCM19037_1605 [Geomicrobium sp. JCM 19037]